MVGGNLLEAKFEGDLLKEGDKNIKVFHIMANSHKRRNTIERIRIGGEWLTREENVRTCIINSFKELLIAPRGWRAT